MSVNSNLTFSIKNNADNIWKKQFKHKRIHTHSQQLIVYEKLNPLTILFTPINKNRNIQMHILIGFMCNDQHHTYQIKCRGPN